MSYTEKVISTLVLVILLPIIGWLLSTVSINSGRIAVLEQRTANHVKAMDKLEEALDSHRKFTERMH